MSVNIKQGFKKSNRKLTIYMLADEDLVRKFNNTTLAVSGTLIPRMINLLAREIIKTRRISNG